ncbi:hypothetical protein CDAR_105131 [Caerostris darwini]|uniref:Secreted protein n=1 Tax=Caerostris darwini TaxID=1538125 RepID=A0AAV4V6H9_9ARAC|nr:hypothetical protein CDAR_105131 [Caerostris darwini]
MPSKRAFLFCIFRSLWRRQERENPNLFRPERRPAYYLAAVENDLPIVRPRYALPPPQAKVIKKILFCKRQHILRRRICEPFAWWSVMNRGRESNPFPVCPYLLRPAMDK